MAGVRRIKPETEKEICLMYAQGVRASELAERFGLNRKTVTTVVRRNGGVVLDQRAASGLRPLVHSNSLFEQVKALRLQGKSIPAIQEQIGFGRDTVIKLLRKAGLHAPMIRRGERHKNWKGGVVYTGHGYLMEAVPDTWPWPEMQHNSTGYCLQHRMRMAEHLGRALKTHETVHHINGDRTDNRIENLQLRNGKHGSGQCLRCADCGSTNIKHEKIADR